MPFFLLLLMGLLSQSSFASRPACVDIFALKPQRARVSLDTIFVSQAAIGHQYALFKAFTEAGISTKKNLADLSRKELSRLRKSVLSEIKERLPAVIAPDGKIFILDGHHDLYMLHLLGVPLRKVEIELDVIRDFRWSGLTLENFIQQAREQQWFHGPLESLITRPRGIESLQDSPARSAMGLVFLEIEKQFDVAMKGKHFRQFIQFRAVEVLRDANLWPSKDIYSQDDVLQLTQIVLFHRPTLLFLLENLRSTAPKKLSEFLQEQVEIQN